MKHKVRKATTEEAQQDCCGDRYPCYVDMVCSCGLKLCKMDMLEHLLQLHGGSRAR